MFTSGAGFNQTKKMWGRPQASLSSSVATPTAHQLDYNHDGQVSGNVVPNVSKVYSILAKNTVPQTAFNGALNQVEYEFPQFLGKIVDNTLQFQITVTSTDAISSNKVVQLSPTTTWFSRVEVLYDSQVVESVEPYETHTEVVTYSTDQEFKQIAKTINLGTDGNFAAAVACSTASTDIKTFYLPLWANFFSTAQPYVAGFSSRWRFRFTFAPGIVVAAGTTATGVSITLNSMTLYTTEANISDGAAAGLDAAHKTGILYRSVIRNKFSKSEATIPGGSASTPYNQVLTTFGTDSAGLLVYAIKDSTAAGDSLTTYALDSLELRDSANAQLTITLPAGLINSYIMPVQTPFNSFIYTNSAYNVYLFPFASNLLKVLETGKNLGGLHLSNQERIQFVPPQSLTNVKVCVISYEYSLMQVRGRAATITRSA
jgi:hypothetical protein